MRSLRRILATTSTLGLLLVGLVFASPASATVFNCNDVITASNTTIVLTADVGPCNTQNGLIVDQSVNLTLDLNGHSIIGMGIKNTNFVGIDLQATSNVTVKNGTVTGWDSGIFIDGGFGIGGDHNTVTRTRLVDNIGPDPTDIFGEGLQIFQGNANTITGNVVVHNGPFAGIDAYESANTTISGNQVANNNILDTSGHHGGGGPIMQDIGIWVVNLSGNPAFTMNNTVTGNSVSGNGLDGIQIARFTNNNVVQGNAVANNGFGQPATNSFRDGDGIANFGSFNRILTNASNNNAANGISVRRSVNSSGVPVGGQSNTIQSNAARGNGTGVHSGGVAFDLTDTNFTPPCDANTWNANVFGTRNQACVH